MSKDLIILSINLRKNHADLSSVLETTLADILLVQEPSWVRLVPLRSDSDPSGTETRGSINHPKWHALFPSMAGPAPDACPLIAIFLRKSSTHSFIVSILPSFSSLASLGITISDPAPGSGPDHDSDGRSDSQTVSANGSTADAFPLGSARETRGAMTVDESLAASLTHAPLQAPVTALHPPPRPSPSPPIPPPHPPTLSP